MSGIQHAVVKWQKTKMKLDIDTAAGVAGLKAQLQELTNIPVDRMKLVCGSLWKGTLKDDADFGALRWKKKNLILLTGTPAEQQLKAAPTEKIHFAEDMTAAEQAKSGMAFPPGINNLGNTCYMNSTLQCLKAVPEFNQSLQQFSAAQAQAPRAGDGNGMLTSQLGSLFRQMDNTLEPVTPFGFVQVLRQVFAQFDEKNPKTGYHRQQDADELQNAVMTAVANAARQADPGALLGPSAGQHGGGATANVVDALFGIEFSNTLKCLACDAEPAVLKSETARKLVCNISRDVSHMYAGLKMNLEGNLEKMSGILGQTVPWSTTKRIKRLPRYICIQFNRFYWKQPDGPAMARDHPNGLPCKMVKAVSFPEKLDMFDFCDDSLQALLKPVREAFAVKYVFKTKTMLRNEEQ